MYLLTMPMYIDLWYESLALSIVEWPMFAYEAVLFKGNRRINGIENNKQE